MFTFEPKRLIVPLIQLIMPGMGTSLTVADFVRVFRMPKPVFI
jgi:bile acid:Na+ symporter, BASS family